MYCAALKEFGRQRRNSFDEGIRNHTGKTNASDLSSIPSLWKASTKMNIFVMPPLEMNATILASCHAMSSLHYQKQTSFLKGSDYNYLFIISLESGRKQQLSHRCILHLWNNLVGWDETSIIWLVRGHRATKVIKQESSVITDLTLIPERL